MSCFRTENNTSAMMRTMFLFPRRILMIWILSSSLMLPRVAVLAEPLWKDVCTQEATRSLRFCDESLDLSTRAADYVSRIPTEQQILMMGNIAHSYDDLHIPTYQWWSEGLHGPLEPCVKYQEHCSCPTSFPSPSAMGNAFNRTLYHIVGHVIGMEGKAIANLRPHNVTHPDIGDGLTYWSPTVNMQRDPRWGRNQEVPGEDPFLTSQYATAFVNGLQGAYTRHQGNARHDNDRVRVGACCKHFVANSLEHWYNYSRHNFDAHIDHQDLYDYYFPPFKACSQQAVGVMCSYNSLNGKPACAHPWLLQEVLRKQMNFTGYVVTDCGALGDVRYGHHFAKTDAEASALSKNASVDINCGNGQYYPTALLQAYQDGSVQASTIQESFARMAMVQFRLSLFDVSTKEQFNPLQDIATIGRPEHQQIAYEAALQSIVLLQHNNHLLPLDRDTTEKVAVIGPHLNATYALLSNYHGSKCDCPSTTQSGFCIETPLQAITRTMTHLENIQAIKGCNVVDTDLNEIDAAKALAAQSDLVLLFVGIDGSVEQEGLDRTETTLPGLQSQLVESILEVATGRTILVLLHGGAMSLGNDVIQRAGAILSAGYGGESGSAAIASVLFGDYNPTGKLAATWYPSSYVTDIPLTEMGLRVGVGRTHMFYKGTPEFPFGHGLSYSTWHMEWVDNPGNDGNIAPIVLPSHGTATTRIQVTIQNLGSPGHEYDNPSKQTVVLFWRPSIKTLGEQHLPRQKLIDFQETSRSLRKGEQEVIEFNIETKDFAMWDPNEMLAKCTPGIYELVVAASGIQITRAISLMPSIVIDRNTDDKLLIV